MMYFVINKKHNIVEYTNLTREQAIAHRHTGLWVPNSDFSELTVSIGMYWEQATNVLRPSLYAELKSFYIYNLEQTDWQVTRHRDQIALAVVTTLTDEEYLVLLTKRQEWRDY